MVTLLSVGLMAAVLAVSRKINQLMVMVIVSDKGFHINLADNLMNFTSKLSVLATL